MLRRLFTTIVRAIVTPPLLVLLAVLVMIGLRDIDLLTAIVSRLIVVVVVIAIPVMLVRTIILPGKKEDGRR